MLFDDTVPHNAMMMPTQPAGLSSLARPYTQSKNVCSSNFSTSPSPALWVFRNPATTKRRQAASSPHLPFRSSDQTSVVARPPRVVVQCGAPVLEAHSASTLQTLSPVPGLALNSSIHGICRVGVGQLFTVYRTPLLGHSALRHRE